MINNSVAAVVVTYNRKELLLENIKCLLSQKPLVPSIIVIDNHSTDGTKDVLQGYIDNEEIIYCDTGANLGGAGGFSYGVKYAVEQGYEYIWIMDDDCMPTEDALNSFILTNKELNGNYGFLSSKVLWKDGTICTMNLQRRTVTKNLKDFNKRLQSVVMASFVSLYIPSKVVKKVGLPIKDFFIWTDDWEYTRRISRNFRCYAVSDSVVVHKSRTNIGANVVTETVDRLDRFDYLYRNDVYLYRREGLIGFCYEVVRLSWHIVKVILLSKDNKCKRLKKIFNGTKNGLSFKPKVEYIK